AAPPISPPFPYTTLFRSHPERFSPNVLLRPLYQETILPNVAYIGGGGELAYWLQLKPLFDRSAIPMPVLLLRTSVALLPQKEFRSEEHTSELQSRENLVC